VTRLTGVGGEATSILALFAAGGWGDLVEGPASYSMSRGESMGAGLLCTAAILLLVWVYRGQMTESGYLSYQLFDSVIGVLIPLDTINTS